MTEEMVERFVDAASRGDVAAVSSLISRCPSLLDRPGANGWNALMLAARNGHYTVTETLLSHGFEPQTSITQTKKVKMFKTHVALTLTLCFN